MPDLLFLRAAEMAVGWNTFQQITTPTVYYGFTPNTLYFKAASHSSITYPTSRTWANTVLIENLSPATTYCQYFLATLTSQTQEINAFSTLVFHFADYKIGSTNSSIDSFTTGRVAGDHTPFNAALVIDMGVFGTYGLTIDEMKRDNIPIAPELKHTTIDRLVQIANQYDFVVSRHLPGGLCMYVGRAEMYGLLCSCIREISPMLVSVRAISGFPTSIDSTV
jgi:hypothetical protein